MASFPRKRESMLTFIASPRRAKWITRGSCRAPHGPASLFAPASCLRSPAFAGMTSFFWTCRRGCHGTRHLVHLPSLLLTLSCYLLLSISASAQEPPSAPQDPT